ncbi:MAG: hypothetical protein IT162_09985 [Bryobacterales bacterium]|nr:hypothetical protein [Bryobacterales bacterium]
MARQAHALLTRQACAERWQDGLWDADDQWDYQEVTSLLESAGGHGKHFYNAARLDSFGATTRALGYWYNFQDTSAELELGKNARATALATFGGIGTLKGDMAADRSPCYRLGVLLHYLTDLTQPMHTSGWDAGSIPLKFHVDFEDWVSERQFAFDPRVVLFNTPSPLVQSAPFVWDQRFKNLPLEAVIYQVARQSNGFAGRLRTHMVPTYSVFWRDEGSAERLRERWSLTQEILADAIQSTASSIYAVVNSLRDGSVKQTRVIRNASSGAVYLDQGGNNPLIHIPDPETLAALGFTSADLLNVAGAPAQPNGPSYPHLAMAPETYSDDIDRGLPPLHFGRLLIDPQGTVHLLDRGFRRGVTSLHHFPRLGWYRSLDSVPISNEDLLRIPAGPNIRVEDFIFEGLLVRDPASGRVDRITAGARKGIPSIPTLVALGLRGAFVNFPDVAAIPDSGQAYPLLAEGKLPRDPVTGAVYLLRNGIKHHIYNIFTFDTLGLNWTMVENHSAGLDQIPDGFKIHLNPPGQIIR